MITLRKISLLLVALCLTATFAYANHPDATLRLNGTAVAAGVGFNWGKGTLTYHGKSYAVSVKGLDLGKVGITKVTASGSVFGLKNLSDFSGNYTTAGADITLAGGHSATVLKNQNGVQIAISATSKGVDLTVGASGVEMKLKN